MIGVKSYVVGFMMDPTLSQVVLIRKNRPAAQVGKLNGVGGKVEQGETPLDAMSREFREETGMETTGWRLFSIYNGGDLGIPGSLFEIYFYWLVGDVNQAQTVTDEQVHVIEIESLSRRVDKMSNLAWLVQMAIGLIRHDRETRYFDIQERYTCLEDVNEGEDLNERLPSSHD
jgi:8-oxo-dGTP diphosphatase